MAAAEASPASTSTANRRLLRNLPNGCRIRGFRHVAEASHPAPPAATRSRKDGGFTPPPGRCMAAYTLRSGAQVRQAEAIRAAVAELREVQREAAEDAKPRDERAAELQQGLNRLTKRLVLLGGLTLAASVLAVRPSPSSLPVLNG